MDRILEIFGIINKHLDKIDRKKNYLFEDTTFGEMLHAYGTAYISAAISVNRGLDPKLAFIIGLLHDSGRIIDGVNDGRHGAVGAKRVKEILESQGDYTKEELDIIFKAIENHSNKKDIGDPYDEIVKDADIIERIFIMKERYEKNKKKRKRLKGALGELGLKLTIKSKL